MIFSSFLYVFFLSILVLLYWRLPARFRVTLLLLASYVFYMSWSPPFGLIYGPLIFLDSLYFYGLSKAMLRWAHLKKMILIFGVTSELLVLAFFKYANFLSHTLDVLMQWAQLPAPHMEFNIFLPLAISFTNFILISYLVDVYRGRETPSHSFISFATYVAFFPHLIAGPIVRASELLQQFESKPSFQLEQFTQGIHKFIAGLAIKVFIADMLAPYVNLIYGDVALQGFNTSWIATYAFAAQIFCDFAGYTLMAQGSALLLGYTLPENFNAPYFAKNISAFWQRWHMSLSRWLKDYLYIPLGGNRNGHLATYRNLFITMGLGGLWHGASWNFVIWGLYQGLLLSLHKLAEYLKLNKLIATPLAVLLTFHCVCIGWVFFRADSFAIASHMISTMFQPTTSVPLSSQGSKALVLVGLFLTGHALIRYGAPYLKNEWVRMTIQGVAYAALLFLGITLKSTPQTFIYFQF